MYTVQDTLEENIYDKMFDSALKMFYNMSIRYPDGISFVKKLGNLEPLSLQIKFLMARRF